MQGNNFVEKKIGNYAYYETQVLGTGTYGTVYLGRNVLTQVQVAIKSVSKHMIGKTPQTAKYFSQEIEILTKLKSEYIVKFLEIIESQSNYFIILEYCKEGTLRKTIQTRKIFSEKDAIIILKDILLGFKELLKNGIIHRDLKPENILKNDNKYKLADFGFSRNVDIPKEQILTSIVGTPLYMSPQILSQIQYTSKSDIWSIGLILYEMVQGQLPFSGNNLQHLLNNIINTSIVFNDKLPISNQCKDFILQCLTKNETSRINWINLYQHPLFQGSFNADAEELVQAFLNKQSMNFPQQVYGQPLQNVQGGIQNMQGGMQNPQPQNMNPQTRNQKSTSFVSSPKANEINNVIANKDSQSQLYVSNQPKYFYTIEEVKMANLALVKIKYALGKNNTNIKELRFKSMKAKHFINWAMKIDSSLKEDELQCAFDLLDSFDYSVINSSQLNDALDKHFIVPRNSFKPSSNEKDNLFGYEIAKKKVDDQQQTQLRQQFEAQKQQLVEKENKWKSDKLQFITDYEQSLSILRQEQAKLNEDKKQFEQKQQQQQLEYQQFQQQYALFQQQYVQLQEQQKHQLQYQYQQQQQQSQLLFPQQLQKEKSQDQQQINGQVPQNQRVPTAPDQANVRALMKVQMRK